MSPDVAKRVSPTRALGVTAALCLAGGVVGALLGVGLLAILSLVVDGRGGFPYIVEAYALAAAVGGVLGGVLVPVSAWTLLRRVPFGLVFAGASAGTAAGGTLGLLLSGLDPLMAVAGAVSGYLVSAAYLYRRSRSVQTSVTQRAQR
ncbi:MAG TPA: hypothetical protein VGB92_07885 [Longimicrobium sp.]|jgi:hypothetical protein